MFNQKPSAWLARRKVTLIRAIRDDSGATAIEYALIGSLVSIAIVVTLALVSDKITILFTKISDAF